MTEPAENNVIHSIKKNQQCKQYLLARMKAIRPNKKPNSQNTKQARIICGMNVFLPFSCCPAFACRMADTGGGCTCPVLASCTT